MNISTTKKSTEKKINLMANSLTARNPTETSMTVKLLTREILIEEKRAKKLAQKHMAKCLAA